MYSVREQRASYTSVHVLVHMLTGMPCLPGTPMSPFSPSSPSSPGSYIHVCIFFTCFTLVLPCHHTILPFGPIIPGGPVEPIGPWGPCNSMGGGGGGGGGGADIHNEGSYN